MRWRPAPGMIVYGLLISAEPGYAAQVPVAYGGSAVPPGGHPDIAGPAWANIVYQPFLSSGVDNDDGEAGFQPVPNTCNGCLTGNLVTNVNTGAVYCSIQAAIDDPLTLNGHVIDVDPGLFQENVVLNKSLTLNGAKVGVDARGRVAGAPNPAVESVLAPPSGLPIELVSLSLGSVINGFAIVGSLNGATGAISSNSGPINGLQLRNNQVQVAAGFTASALWLNDHGTDITIDQNEFIAATGSAQAVHFDTDVFHGLRFTALAGGHRLSEALKIDAAADADLPARVYYSAFAESGVQLRYWEATGTIDPGSGALLLQNRPNPFSDRTTIGFVLPEACDATLRVFDATGRLLREQTGQYASGEHWTSFDFSGTDTSGVFFCELTTPQGVLTKRMVRVGK